MQGHRKDKAKNIVLLLGLYQTVVAFYDVGDNVHTIPVFWNSVYRRVWPGGLCIGSAIGAGKNKKFVLGVQVER